MARILLLLLYRVLGLAVANAQTIVTSSASSVAASTTVSQAMPPAATQGFNIGLVSVSDLFNWCLAQQHTCPQMCLGAASVNTCDSTTLIYSCVCPNGTVPDSSAFQQTVPFFICEANYGQCVARNANQAEALAACRANQQCGTRNATAEALAVTAAVLSATGSSTLSTSLSSSVSTYASLMVTSSRASSNTSVTPTDTSSSSNPGPVSSPSPHLSSGLSSAAYAGIGVGATLAVVSLAAILFFFFKRHRRTFKNKNSRSQAQTYPETSAFRDTTSRSELQANSGGKEFTTGVHQKPEMQTTSNRHEAEGISASLDRPWSIDGRYELHEDSVSYQRNGGLDGTTKADDETIGHDNGWGGGPGAANSDSRSAR